MDTGRGAGRRKSVEVVGRSQSRREPWGWSKPPKERSHWVGENGRCFLVETKSLLEDGWELEMVKIQSNVINTNKKIAKDGKTGRRNKYKRRGPFFFLKHVVV